MAAPSGQAASISWDWYLTRLTSVTCCPCLILNPCVSSECRKLRSRHRKGACAASTCAPRHGPHVHHGTHTRPKRRPNTRWRHACTLLPRQVMHLSHSLGHRYIASYS